MDKSETLRFALIGTGFWSRFQLAAWQELEGVECVALVDKTLDKAAALAEEFAIGAIYDDAEKLLAEQAIDFADVVTSAETHAPLCLGFAEKGIATICQKPLASDWADAREVVDCFGEAGVPFFVHENWRWQTPIRALKAKLDRGAIGRPWRARIQYCNSFPVFENQPFLKDLDQFILMDIGTHILDTARFLFGEARSLYGKTHRVNRGIRGEDAATVILEMASGLCLTIEMSYASKLKDEAFPQTYVVVEGEAASLKLTKDYWIHETDASGTRSEQFVPVSYRWADPDYDLVHSSIVDCNRDLLAGLRGEQTAETCGSDNLRTLQLVFDSYESARSGAVIRY